MINFKRPDRFRAFFYAPTAWSRVSVTPARFYNSAQRGVRMGRGVQSLRQREAVSMRAKIDESVGFLRATAIGGLFFLLPLAVIAGLLGQVYGIVAAVAGPLGESLPSWLPIDSAMGIAFLFSASVAIIVVGCFLAGVVARRAIGKKFSSTIEKQLITVFPKYAIYKDLLAGNLKHDSDGPTLMPILVECPEGLRIAMEADRLPGGMVVVYFPGARTLGSDPSSWCRRIESTRRNSTSTRRWACSNDWAAIQAVFYAGRVGRANSKDSVEQAASFWARARFSCDPTRPRLCHPNPPASNAPPPSEIMRS